MFEGNPVNLYGIHHKEPSVFLAKTPKKNTKINQHHAEHERLVNGVFGLENHRGNCDLEQRSVCVVGRPSVKNLVFILRKDVIDSVNGQQT